MCIARVELSYAFLSVKWIGLFVTSVVGVYTLQDLWDKFGDLRMPVVRVRSS